MDWIYLIFAGLCEIGWPVGLKLAQTTSNKFLGIIIAIIAMALSGLFLWIAQKTIPIGTAYAVWTGIGTAGTFIVGVIYFNEPSSILRMVSISLILFGIVGLKLSH